MGPSSMAATPADNNTGTGPLMSVQRPQFGGFQMPSNSQQQQLNWHIPQLLKTADQQQPHFVVFELANSTTAWAPTTNGSSNALKAIGQQQKNEKLTTTTKWPPSSAAAVPFLPIGKSAAVFSLQQADTANALDEDDDPAAVRFTTIQLCGWKQQQQRANNRHSSGRLLFDNPMFRRLPNWHFFGDDRRVMRIPPVIPLLIPVERTLLSITPSLSWISRLILTGTLDKQMFCGKNQWKRAAALEYGSDHEEEISSREEESAAPFSPETELPPDSGCWPSSSGVETMSSVEGTRTTATPTTEGGSSSPLSRALTPNDLELLEGTASANHLKNAESSSVNSASSSTPNSPPTFDRRTLRMSRSTRNAILRLSISRRFDDNEESEECNKNLEAPASTYEQMSLRTRHISSNGSVGSGHHTQQRAHQQHQTQQSSKPPLGDGGISCMDVLSEFIYNFHQNMEQNNLHLNRKLMLRDQLYYAISPVFPLCGLYIVGSSMNGFGTSCSDLDLCLMIANQDIDQRKDAVVILTSVMGILENLNMVVNQQLILAKVPILRIKCSGVFSDIVVDLNVNNSVAIRNTHLMCYYSAFDWRVRPIVMVVKEWAKRRGINNSSRSSFTSYSLVLMVIHYLQCGAKPPVLPSLQQLYPKRFNQNIDVRLLNVSQHLEPLASTMWRFDQRLSLSELLLGFLHYYAYEFNFDTDAISIRLGRKVDRAQVANNQSPFNTLSQWHCICIEEPFTLSNAAHSVFDQRIFEGIKKQFADSFHDLDKYRDLDSFLGPPLLEAEENGAAAEPPEQQLIIPNDEKADVDEETA